MANYGSNYPSNSGPPPPTAGYGIVNQNPNYGVYGAGSYAQTYGSQGGAVSGFTVPPPPAQYQIYSNQAPQSTMGNPPQMPSSMQYNQMQSLMTRQSHNQLQWKMYQQMGLIEADPQEEAMMEVYQQKQQRCRRMDVNDVDVDDGAEVQEEAMRMAEARAQAAEEKARQLQATLESNDGLKQDVRARFVDELMRRQEVSGTFEETMGTVFPFTKYDGEDPVAKYFSTDKSEDISGEGWDPLYDCEYLRKGMRGLGTDEQCIISVTSTRSNTQRNKIMKEYKTAYGRDLIKDLKSELSGDFEEAILACYETPARYDAWACKKAIYGAGTDEATLIEIMMTRTNDQIKEMVKEYNQITYQRQRDPESSLEKDITEDTSGDFKRLLISASQGNRRLVSRDKLEDAVEEVMINDRWTGMFQVNYEKLCNVKKCRRMAEELFKAGEDKWGTDEETFNRIFSTQDNYTLRFVWSEYVKISQRDILNSVDRETSGDLKKGLCAIAQNIKCRPMYLAERLHGAMKGLGTNDSCLIRNAISRSEIDMVQIKACFLERYKQTLWNFIKDDTSGDYRKLLLAIVGRD